MSANTPPSQVALYLSPPQDCDYLPEEQAQNIFLPADTNITPAFYELLLEKGFRRSGNHAYRPHCSSCHACIPCRLNAFHFKPSRSQRRVLTSNQDLTFTVNPTAFNEEHYALYLRYQAFKHPGGSMQRFDRQAYQSFLCQSFGNSAIYETRLNHQLLAVSVTDIFADSLSAVYTFFDPDFAMRSLGTYCILKQIDAAKTQEKTYLYLGYYLTHSNKMAYKANYRPLELRVNDQWLSYDKGCNVPEQSASNGSPLTF